jgi:luciferase family oxidoreductase group 1
VVELSILDLGRMRAGATRRDAIDEARDLACHAEAWGYRRFWVAEHHNMPTVTTAATAVVVGHIAAATKTIRVGAGGVMLPNHAPLIIAEQYGTLETLCFLRPQSIEGPARSGMRWRGRTAVR